MKTCFVITAYCNTDEKKKVLNSTLHDLKKIYPGIPTILVSHFPVESDTQFNVDYLVFDKSNPIIGDFATSIWTKYKSRDKNVTITKIFKDVGYTALNQTKLGLSLAESLGFEDAVFLNYDLIIDANLNHLILNENNTFKQFKPDKPIDVAGFDLVAYKLKTSTNNIIQQLITPREYLKKPHDILAEEFIQKILKDHIKIDVIPKNKLNLRTCIDFSFGHGALEIPSNLKEFIKSSIIANEITSNNKYMFVVLNTDAVFNLKIEIGGVVKEYDSDSFIVERLPETFKNANVVEINGTPYNETILNLDNMSDNYIIDF